MNRVLGIKYHVLSIRYKIQDIPRSGIPLCGTRYKIQYGQSLVEVMVTVAILTLVATALVFGTTVAIRNANFAKNQATATKYAQEGMEWLRSQRDQGWDAFVSHSGPSCLNELTWAGTAGFCSSSNYSLGGMFKRQVVLFNLVDKIQAKVIVSWQDAAGTHQSELTSYFTKWQ